jgi:hypothetical protein
MKAKRGDKLTRRMMSETVIFFIKDKFEVHFNVNVQGEQP